MGKDMKMIYVGSMSTKPDRDSGWVKEIRQLGWQVHTFVSDCDIATGILGKVKRRFNVGNENRRMQSELIALVRQVAPAWVHFRLPIAFDRETICQIKSQGALVTQYFNDDPFSRKSPFGLHWKFRQALSAYDAHFVYRRHNVTDYGRVGATYVEHCPPCYDPGRHTRHNAGAKPEYLADAAFIGHWEDDWRVDCLDALMKSGLRVILRGGLWDKAIEGTSLSELSPIVGAYGSEYNEIYAKCFAGLCFFSKINRDTWTERALEIVAVGGVLVCERTDEAAQFFKDREEAFFFSSIDELLAIVCELKRDPNLRARVQQAGYTRLQQGGHTIRDRALQVARFVQDSLPARTTDL